MLAIPDWKSFVHNPWNKSNCLHYMGESWTSKHTLLPAGFTLILRGVLRDPGRTVQLSVDRGNDSESLNVQGDGISSARFYVRTLSTGMILKEIWMRYEPITLTTLEETCVHCFLHTCIYLFH